MLWGFGIFLFTVWGLVSSPAWAHFAERYGMGLTGASSARAVAARCKTNSHAAYYNPALLACDSAWRAEVNYVHSYDSFDPISNVLVSSSNYPTNPSPVSITNSSVNTNYANHQAIQIGLQMPFLHRFNALKKRKLKLGFSMHFNTDHLVSLNANYAFLPAYTLYDRRDRRFFLTSGMGAELIEDRFWVGLATQFNISAGISASMVYEQTNTAGQTATDMDPQLAIVLGTRVRPFKSWPFFVVFVFHQEASQVVNTQARTDIVISGGSGTPFSLTTKANLYHEPHRVRFGLAWEDTNWSAETNIVFNLWDQIDTSRTQLTFTSPAKTSTLAANVFQNNIVIHTGGSFAYQRFELLGGVSFEPSMVRTMNDKENELDTDKLVLGVGLFYDLPWVEKLRAGLSYQHQHLFKKTVTKLAGTSIGAPGFTVGGSVHMIQLGVDHAF